MRHDDLVRAIGYVRVSTDDQGEHGASLAAQETMLREEARRRGWDLLAVYSDVASGKSMKRRPGLADALDALEGKGPWSDPPAAIMVVRLDRLTRSVVDGGQMFDRAKRRRWNIVALDLGVDTTTAAGKLVANVMMSVGQWHREVIGEATRDGLAQRRREGVRLGRVPAVELEGEEGDRARATLARLLALKEAGESNRAAARILNEEGRPGFQGGTWSEKQVRRTLADHRTRTIRQLELA